MLLKKALGDNRTDIHSFARKKWKTTTNLEAAAVIFWQLSSHFCTASLFYYKTAALCWWNHSFMQTKTVRTGTPWTVPPLSASSEYPVSHTATEATYDGRGPHCPTTSHHLCWFALELGTVCCRLMISVSVEHYVCLVGWVSQNAHGRIRVSNTQASIFTTVAKQQGICNRFPNLDQKWHVE